MTSTIEDYISAETGKTRVSEWIAVEQSLIDRFADTTRDWNFIHVDAHAARAAGMDGTIGHGFLTLSLLAPMRLSASRPAFPALRYGLNYGLDKVRFLSPVPSGSRIRGHFTISAIDETSPGHYRETMDVSVEIEDRERPALVAKWLTMYVV